MLSKLCSYSWQLQSDFNLDNMNLLLLVNLTYQNETVNRPQVCTLNYTPLTLKLVLQWKVIRLSLATLSRSRPYTQARRAGSIDKREAAD